MRPNNDQLDTAPCGTQTYTFPDDMSFNQHTSEWHDQDYSMPISLSQGQQHSSPASSVGNLSEPFDGPSSSSSISEGYDHYQLGQSSWNLDSPQGHQPNIRIDTAVFPPQYHPATQYSLSSSQSATMCSNNSSTAFFGLQQSYAVENPFNYITQPPSLSPSDQSPSSAYPQVYPTLPHTPPVIPRGFSPSLASPGSFQSGSEVGSPHVQSVSHQIDDDRTLYSHKDQLQFFKDANNLDKAQSWGPMVPQPMYRPHTNSDRRRYVEDVKLEGPIYFYTEDVIGQVCGISLSDALHSRVKKLLGRDETVFEGRGPSVSIRLEWPGYRQWSRQIPTKDFRSPPGPITRAKLAKNVAKCVQRFILERQNHPLEDDADDRWRVGTHPQQIKFDDLVLVSIHHVSMGSWQPQLRLKGQML